MSRPGKKLNKQQKHALGMIRIIGGDWRGRKLPVLSKDGLRPTSDRMRETLFNWLQFEIAGACCLDAFAGSGALGFEALSRGASSVVFIEKNAEVAQQLLSNCALLKTQQAQVFNIDSQAWLNQNEQVSFDLVFIDPPFHQCLVEPTLQALLAAGRHYPAWLYIEQEKTLAWPEACLSQFELYREKTNSQARLGLWRFKHELKREASK